MTDPDLPVYARAFEIADRTAAAAQQTHLRLTRLELALLVLAAGSELATLPLGEERARVASVLGVFLFASTLVLRAYRMSIRPTTAWQEARAAAESVKTLCWRYAVGSKLFPVTADAVTTDRLFVERLRDILESMRDIQTVHTPDSSHEEVTQWMRRVRSADLEVRRAVYERDRIEDQQRWYSARAESNRRQSRRWNVVVLLFELLGVVAASMKAVGFFIDAGTTGLLGLLATLGAAATAWVQTKQYAALAAAYSIAHEELAIIRVLAPHASTEEQWIQFVDSAESAISREHTMWRASRTA